MSCPLCGKFSLAGATTKLYLEHSDKFAFVECSNCHRAVVVSYEHVGIGKDWLKRIRRIPHEQVEKDLEMHTQEVLSRNKPSGHIN